MWYGLINQESEIDDQMSCYLVFNVNTYKLPDSPVFVLISLHPNLWTLLNLLYFYTVIFLLPCQVRIIAGVVFNDLIPLALHILCLFNDSG